MLRRKQYRFLEILLGALGKNDIGTLFPDTDSKYKNIDSKLL
ncbi:MAG: 2-C-methyl-D-erythritol 2,4-cyclodiphosphate synthase, partial [Tissierellales bacterium]|nr:2-C-methyl-D-erythritol 2,4-cyclodiphosphate synthase [Tissierellales bacterium]